MLNHERAKKCYEMIMGSSLKALRRELFQKASDYAHHRATWQMMSREDRRAADQRRTLAHNAFIDSVNIMSRNMSKQDEDNSWRADLTDDRKIIGDFACYVHLFLGLEAR